MKNPGLKKRLALGLTMLLGSGVAMAECGDVQIAEWNWASGELMANVDKIILEAGYGCSVEKVPGATTTTFASMNEKGQPDIAGELWINAVREPLFKAMDEGSLISANANPITGLGEGWWIPPHTAEKYPELKTVLDILERPDLFPDTEDPSKGAFVSCPAGWGCQLTNANLFRAFDMEAKGWKLVDPGSAAGLDGSMTKAVERGENWFGYYWSPTAMIGKHGMVKLPFGVDFAGSENWDGCIVKAEQDCADPKPSSWTQSEVHTVVTDDFKSQAGEDVMGYLGNRIFPGEVMNGMLVYMGDNQAGGEDAAIEFLIQHGDVWESWVSADVADKVKSAIN
jgi:glycine betaine/proline transport system substrate-binding protein